MRRSGAATTARARRAQGVHPVLRGRYAPSFQTRAFGLELESVDPRQIGRHDPKIGFLHKRPLEQDDAIVAKSRSQGRESSFVRSSRRKQAAERASSFASSPTLALAPE